MVNDLGGAGAELGPNLVLPKITLDLMHDVLYLKSSKSTFA